MSEKNKNTLTRTGRHPTPSGLLCHAPSSLSHTNSTTNHCTDRQTSDHNGSVSSSHLNWLKMHV